MKQEFTIVWFVHMSCFYYGEKTLGVIEHVYYMVYQHTPVGPYSNDPV